MHEFLSYLEPRQNIQNSFDKSNAAKNELRQADFAEKRRIKESISNR